MIDFFFFFSFPATNATLFSLFLTIPVLTNIYMTMERVSVSFSLCFSPSGEDANGQWDAEETDSRGEDKQKPES